MIRKFDLVVSLYIFGVITAEILGSKTFPLGTVNGFEIHASVAIAVMPLLFTLTDVVVEVLGKKRARSMVWCGIITAALLILYTTFATTLPPTARSAATEAAYDTILGTSARLAAASLTAFAISELLDVFVFGKLRERMHKKALWLRNNVSNIVSQFADSAIFLTLAFYAFDKSFGANIVFLLGLLLPYWLLRCVVSAVETPFVYLGVKWLRAEAKEAE